MDVGCVDLYVSARIEKEKEVSLKHRMHAAIPEQYRAMQIQARMKESTKPAETRFSVL